MHKFIIKTLNCKKEFENEIFDRKEVIKHDEKNFEVNECVKADINAHSVVIAGPGAGKTRYIIDRTKCLIKDKDIKPENISLISFIYASLVEIDPTLFLGLLLIQNDLIVRFKPFYLVDLYPQQI